MDCYGKSWKKKYLGWISSSPWYESSDGIESSSLDWNWDSGVSEIVGSLKLCFLTRFTSEQIDSCLWKSHFLARKTKNSHPKFQKKSYLSIFGSSCLKWKIALCWQIIDLSIFGWFYEFPISSGFPAFLSDALKPSNKPWVMSCSQSSKPWLS